MNAMSKYSLMRAKISVVAAERCAGSRSTKRRWSPSLARTWLAMSSGGGGAVGVDDPAALAVAARRCPALPGAIAVPAPSDLFGQGSVALSLPAAPSASRASRASRVAIGITPDRSTTSTNSPLLARMYIVSLSHCQLWFTFLFFERASRRVFYFSQSTTCPLSSIYLPSVPSAISWNTPSVHGTRRNSNVPNELDSRCSMRAM